MAELSLLDIVDLCDNARPTQSSFLASKRTAFDDERLIPFYLFPAPTSAIIGLLRPIIVELLSLETTGAWNIEDKRISFQASVNSPAKRTAVMKELCERWRDLEVFVDVCGPQKWRNELYPIWKDPFGANVYPAPDDDSLNFAFDMERSACALFGVVTYGVHLSVYERHGDDIKIWIPTRAKTKQTWPGYLDNTVAGGIPSGMTPFEALVKECMEEASIAEDIARSHIQSTGAVSYFFRTSQGWLQPEIEYVYDLIIPTGHPNPTAFIPKPLDGEVESFELLALPDVLAKMRKALFKSNCAVVIIDLLIRLGYITTNNEPDFMKLLLRTHNDFDYGRWNLCA